MGCNYAKGEENLHFICDRSRNESRLNSYNEGEKSFFLCFTLPRYSHLHIMILQTRQRVIIEYYHNSIVVREVVVLRSEGLRVTDTWLESLYLGYFWMQKFLLFLLIYFDKKSFWEMHDHECAFNKKQNSLYWRKKIYFSLKANALVFVLFSKRILVK